MSVLLDAQQRVNESKRVEELLNKEADRTILHSPLDYISLNHYVQI